MALRIHAAPAQTFPGVDEKWRRLESPHFELFSHAPDRESRELLRRLELLHAVFGEMVRTQEQRPNLVTIYYFSSETAFNAYTPLNLRKKDRVAGFYLNRPDRSVIVVSPVWDDEGAQRLIFHEYVHHLSRVNGENSALWYTEGIAEFFSTIDEDGKFLSLGLPVNEHVAYLREKRLMPLDALFSVDHTSSGYNETERAGLFYAESWALLHYLYCADIGRTPEKKAARDVFLRLVRNEGEHGNPVEREALFKKCIGMDYQQALAALERYIRSGQYTWSKIATPSIPAMTTYTSTPLSRDEIRVRLAELDLRVNRSAVAKLELLGASTRDPIDVRALEMLGTDALIDGDIPLGMERWQQALEAGTTNPGVVHELATMEGRQWFSQLDVYFELPLPTAQRLRKLLLQSIDRAPNQTQAYETLAWVEATVKKPSAKNVNLVQAHLPALSPRDRTLLALALVRARLNDFATARLLLDQAEKEATAPQALQWSKILRAFVERRESAAATPP